MYSIVLVTAKDKRQARTIAKALLTKKLAACINIIPAIESIYTWQGKIEQGKEVLMLIKIRKTSFKHVASTVKSLHSYTTPEIIALPIVLGEKNYLNWIKASTKGLNDSHRIEVFRLRRAKG